jgi:hemoglobin-like flavoprotein
VGEALLMALADTLGDAFTPELRAAWAEAYALIGPRASLDRHSRHCLTRQSM